MSDVLDQYADRGTPRGAGAVFDAATAAAGDGSLEYVADDSLGGDRTGSFRLTIGIVAVAVVLAAVGFATTRGANEGTTSFAGQSAATSEPVRPLTDPPTQAPSVDPEVEPGWTGYVIDADSVGFVRTEDYWKIDEDHPAPLYDAPNGTHIGYAVLYVGFVDRETFETPGFDLEAYSRAELGDEVFEDLYRQAHPQESPGG